MFSLVGGSWLLTNTAEIRTLLGSKAVSSFVSCQRRSWEVSEASLHIRSASAITQNLVSARNVSGHLCCLSALTVQSLRGLTMAITELVFVITFDRFLPSYTHFASPPADCLMYLCVPYCVCFMTS